MIKNIRIGETLLEFGYITTEQLNKALEIQSQDRKKRLGEILIENGSITENQLLEALAKRLELNIVDLETYPVDIEAVQKLPQQLAEKYEMLAIGFTASQTNKENTASPEFAPINQPENKFGGLTVAMFDPLNFYAIEDVRQLTGMNLKIVLTSRASLKKCIRYYYSEVHARLASDEANRTIRAKADEAISIGDGDAPVIRLLNSFIEHAYSRRASDIHIEPTEGNTIVRMRIDGLLVKFITLQKQVHQPLIARIKIMSGLDIAEKRIPQDGHFRGRFGADGYLVNLRVSVIPTVYGEKAVLRLLTSSAHIDHSEHFGMNIESYEKFRAMLGAPNGIVYLTGPTGSGKSTTLYMALETLCGRPLNISTIEDPVEKQIAGINQMQVNNLSGLTFETGLRALLRQDPDIIMVGETRDSETAKISVRAAITGHLVFSTLHTNSAAASIVRLRDMGVESYLIANSLVGIVAQRLIRKLCPHCASYDAPTPEEITALGAIPEGTKIGHAVGCEQCSHTGYMGRMSIHEILVIDRVIREMITKGEQTEQIEAYAISSQKMKTLAAAARELVISGVTSVSEMQKVAYYAQ